MSKKISQLARSNPGNAGALVPEAFGGATFARRIDAIGGYVSVTEYTGVVGDNATDCTAGLTAAVAAAVAGGYALIWPAGTYLTTASVPLLHTVRHVGPGILKRGADLFNIQPRAAQANSLYISSTGNSANDGITSAQPMATPQNAFDALSNYGPTLEGTWTIKCAAGTWAGTVHRHSLTTPSKNPVIIQGPAVGGHPNVPTAVFDGTLNPVLDDHAINALGYGVQIYLQDLKLQNYVGLSDSNGFYGGYGAAVYWSNLHGAGNSFAVVYLQGCETVRGGGGIWAGTQRAAYVNGCIDTTFGFNSVPVIINNATVGVEWARGSEGHIDICQFNDCGVGVDIFHNARAHLMSNNFKRSTIAAVRARSGGYYYDNGNTMNGGGVDANAVNFLNYVAGGETDGDVWNCQGARRRAYDKNSYNHTGTTGLTAISTLLTGAGASKIPAYWFADDTKKIVLRVWGKWTTSALSAISCSLGGTELDRITLTTLPTAGSDYEYKCEIEARGAANQQIKTTLITDGGPTRVHQANAAVPVNVDLSLAINLKLAAAGDHAEIYWTEAWLIG